MGRKIVGLIFLILVCVGVYYIVQHYRQQEQSTDGEVHWVTGQPTQAEKDAYAKEDSGDVADGQSEHKIRTSRAEDAAGNPEGQAAAGQTITPPATAPTTPARAPAQAAAPPPAPAAYPPANPTPVSYPSYAAGSGGAQPMTDSQAPNAPNGMRYGGSGQFQWYRQGNITYRVDTVSGGICVAFATLEEWRKQIVSSHGCGRGA